MRERGGEASCIERLRRCACAYEYDVRIPSVIEYKGQLYTAGEAFCADKIIPGILFWVWFLILNDHLIYKHRNLFFIRSLFCFHLMNVICFSEVAVAARLWSAAETAGVPREPEGPSPSSCMYAWHETPSKRRTHVASVRLYFYFILNEKTLPACSSPLDHLPASLPFPPLSSISSLARPHVECAKVPSSIRRRVATGRGALKRRVLGAVP